MSDTRQNNGLPAGRPFVIVAIGLCIVFLLSLIDWNALTGGHLKNFNLIGDLSHHAVDSVYDSTSEFIDPTLKEAMADATDILAETVSDIADTVPTHTVSNNAPITANEELESLPMRNIPDQDVKVNDKVVLEDYTLEGRGLSNLKKALSKRDSRPVHIGMIGDSYIEGDIITMDLRDKFQSDYGGRGVGYIAAHSAVQGFRQTVLHTDNGWKHIESPKAAKSDYFTLAGEYYVGGNNSTINLKGIKNNPKLSAWNQSRIVFVAPNSGTIVLNTDDGEHSFEITASTEVQSILLTGETTTLTVASNVRDLILLGVWLEDSKGVVLDNMSIRGDSGISRRNINTSLATQMREYVDYDLIIVEYGINALSAKQTDYTSYSNLMINVLQRIRQSYPNADIILMGIGDRGQKLHGEPHSFPTVSNMIDAQRRAAKTAGVIFWDTREAMGGEDAIVRWREQKLANGDYIHLNHKGGKRLAEYLYESITHALNE